ncbi:hypothetical protein BHE74_00027806 [Ensete ventricosum]|nr:hypothetical protein GW17_00058595 [Ensete ventricosum]RWW64923.1 hypothetical protein BHE74_00027806 [Ensete ventricosum]
MLSCDNEKREGICHEPEPLLVLMGQAAAATGEVTVRQGNNGAVEEEDDDGFGSDVSKAFTVTSLRQCDEETDVVSNVGKAIGILLCAMPKGMLFVEKTEIDRL